MVHFPSKYRAKDKKAQFGKEISTKNQESYICQWFGELCFTENVIHISRFDYLTTFDIPAALLSSKNAK